MREREGEREGGGGEGGEREEGQRERGGGGEGEEGGMEREGETPRERGLYLPSLEVSLVHMLPIRESCLRDLVELREEN